MKETEKKQKPEKSIKCCGEATELPMEHRGVHLYSMTLTREVLGKWLGQKLGWNGLRENERRIESNK